MSTDKTIGDPYVLNTPTPEVYPCSMFGCENPSYVVIAVPFSRHGMSGSIGFYGYCAEHIEFDGRAEHQGNRS